MTHHARIVAWLHLASGVLMLVVLSVVLALLAGSLPGDSLAGGLRGRLGTLGLVVGTAWCLVAGVQLLGGVAALAGMGVARPLLLLSSVFQLINVPVGTALAIYTFWVYARPASGAPQAPGQAGPG